MSRTSTRRDQATTGIESRSSRTAAARSSLRMSCSSARQCTCVSSRNIEPAPDAHRARGVRMEAAVREGRLRTRNRGDVSKVEPGEAACMEHLRHQPGERTPPRRELGLRAEEREVAARVREREADAPPPAPLREVERRGELAEARDGQRAEAVVEAEVELREVAR